MLFGTEDKVELEVLGMTCGHCEAKIEKSLSQLPGVKRVTASRTRKKVTIGPDNSGLMDLQKLKEAIEALGYQVLE